MKKIIVVLLLLLCEAYWVKEFVWGFPSLIALFVNLAVGYYFFVPKSKIAQKPQSISNKNLMYIAILIFVSTVFHFYAIATIPMDMYGFDVARDTQQVQQVVDNKQAYILYQNFSKEPLYYHLAALVDTLVHDEFLSLKIIGAIAGVAATLALFFVLSMLKMRPFTAFFTSMLFAFSSWQMLMERLGYRASLVPFVIFLAFLTTIVYQQSPTLRRAYFLGILLAAGFYIYTTFWVVPIGVGAFLTLSFVASSSKKRSLFLKTIVMSLLTFVIVLAPLISFIYQRPEVYFQRMQQRGQEVASRNFTLEQRAASFYRNYTNSIKGVILAGTAFPPYENTSPFEKGLDNVALGLFIVGLLYGLIKIKEPIIQLALTLIAIAFVPTSLMSIGYETETPNFSRMIVALPMIYVIIAFFVNAVEGFLDKSEKKSSLLTYVACAGACLALVIAGRQNAQRIFVDFPSIYPFNNQPIYSMIKQEHLQYPDQNIYMFFHADPEVMERYIPSYKDRVFFGESIGVADYGRVFMPTMPVNNLQSNRFIAVYLTSNEQQIDIRDYSCTLRKQGLFTFAYCSF